MTLTRANERPAIEVNYREIDWANEPLRQSTVSSYASCGEAFRLEHIYGVKTHTWWATLAGSTIHEITEMLDRRDILGESVSVPGFAETFDKWIDIEGSRATEIKANGRMVLEDSWDGGPDKAKRDRDWWYRWGPRFIDAYLRWRDQMTNWTLLFVEFNFTVTVGEGGLSTGTADRVYVGDDGSVIIMDLKTGYREPPGPLQLSGYREGLHRATGFLAETGFFGKFRWDKDAEEVEFYLSPAIDLSPTGILSTERVEARLAQARAGLVNGVFVANPSDSCRNLCSLYDACWAQGGKDAQMFPAKEGRKGLTLV